MDRVIEWWDRRKRSVGVGIELKVDSGGEQKTNDKIGGANASVGTRKCASCINH